MESLYDVPPGCICRGDGLFGTRCDAPEHARLKGSMERITIKTKPNCNNCLGTGVAQTMYAGVTMVCSCVTEQLRIIFVEKDYSIQDRYRPGSAEYVKDAAPE